MLIALFYVPVLSGYLVAEKSLNARTIGANTSP
jgi:hypothetical protein